MTLPLCHRSTFDVIGPLDGVSLDHPEQETPLFAAGLDFARAEGGPITRAFLAGLPADWRDPVIDSWLVWLTPGLASDDDVTRGFRRQAYRTPPRYRHEPFPGITDGVRGAANRNRAARHRLCAIGLETTPVVAEGSIELDGPDDAAGFWYPTDLAPRDARVRAWIDAGRLTARPVPLAAVIEYGWGALMCPRPAERAGFQFILRATHGDDRPLVDGRRNMTLL